MFMAILYSDLSNNLGPGSYNRRIFVLTHLPFYLSKDLNRLIIAVFNNKQSELNKDNNQDF